MRSTRTSQVPRGESRACESEATAGRGERTNEGYVRSAFNIARTA